MKPITVFKKHMKYKMKLEIKIPPSGYVIINIPGTGGAIIPAGKFIPFVSGSK